MLYIKVKKMFKISKLYATKELSITLQLKEILNMSHHNTLFSQMLSLIPSQIFFAVGTALSDSPPHRSLRAVFPHKAPPTDTWRKSAHSDMDARVSGLATNTSSTC
jgi:hypothetical protein